VRFYSFEKKAATYGYFVDPKKYFKPDLEPDFLQIARRPTGGGIIFHSYDLSFSLIIPSSHPLFFLQTLEAYAFVNSLIINALRKFNLQPYSLHQSVPNVKDGVESFCMASPAKFDVMKGDKKVAGGAQRKTKFAFLHQGTILLTSPREDFLQKVLIAKERIPTQIVQNSFPLLGEKTTSQELREARDLLQTQLLSAISEGIF
jgi:lipoate-protein ligase A